MMAEIVDTQLLITTGIAVIAIAALCFSLSAVKRARRVEQQVQRQLQGLQHDLQVFNSGVIGVGQRLIDTEKRLLNLADKQRELGDGEEGYLPYAEASRLMNEGASVDELIEQCGLSQAEAELIELMHRQLNRPAANA